MMGSVYNAMSEYSQALEYYNKAIEYYIIMFQQKNGIRSASEYRAGVFRSGSNDIALEYFQRAP